MKSIDAIYKFGNLYERTTHKRILIDDGAKVSIVLNEEELLDEDPNLKPKNIMGPVDKKNDVSAFIGDNGKYWKLFNAKQLLYFEITAGIKRKNKIDSFRCIFELQLLEDLYIYNKKKEPKYARFYDCYGVVEKCMPDFGFFEPLYVKSLNDAYTKTYELYFAMFGKSTANSFDRFFTTPDMTDPIRFLAESIQKK